MLDYLFGFTPTYTEKVSYMYNLNHIYLLLFVVASVVALILIFKNKSKKTQNIMLTTVAIVMIVLELARFIWKTANHFNNGGAIDNWNWAWNFSFQLCAIMTWFVSINLLIGVFAKHEKWNKFAFTTMVGIALISGTLTFLYPDLVDGHYSILHFRNAQTIIDHMLLIFVPLFLIFSKRVKIELKNIWMPIVGLFASAAIAMTMSFVTDNNFMFMLKADLLNDIGINLPFPWHLLPLGALFFLFQFLIFGGIELGRKLRTIIQNKKSAKETQ